MGSMLTTEEMYLLLVRANGDPEVAGAPGFLLGHGLTATLATDLLTAGRIALTPDSPAHVHVLSTDPSGVLVLDWGLERVADREGRTLESTLRWGHFNPEVAVVESLVQAGVLERGARKLMGFGMHRVTQPSPAPKQRVQDRLADVFAGDAAPTAGDATIVATMKSLGIAAHTLHALSGATSRDDLDRRIDAIVADTPDGAVAREVLVMPALVPPDRRLARLL